MSEATRLCGLEDIPDGGSKGFVVAEVGDTGELFVVRRGARVHAYVNSCPHIGTPLEIFEDRFLTRDGSRILCTTHGAQFRIEDGYCVAGPCEGEFLEALEAVVRDGSIYLAV